MRLDYSLKPRKLTFKTNTWYNSIRMSWYLILGSFSSTGMNCVALPHIKCFYKSISVIILNYTECRCSFALWHIENNLIQNKQTRTHTVSVMLVCVWGLPVLPRPKEAVFRSTYSQNGAMQHPPMRLTCPSRSEEDTKTWTQIHH